MSRIAEDLMGSTERPQSGWAALIRSQIPWLPGAAAAIFLKYKLIGPVLKNLGDGIDPGARAIELGGGDFGWLDYLSYFRSDLLLCLIAMPAFLFVLARFLSPVRQSWPAALLASAAVLIVYIQRQALNNVGIFLGWPPLIDAAAWGARHPDEILAYMKPGGLLRAAGLLVGIWLSAFVLGRWAWPFKSNFLSRALVQRGCLAAVGSAAAITAAAWLQPTRATWLHKAGLVRAIGPLLSTSPAPAAVARETDLPELQRRYRAMTGAPARPSNSSYFGAAAGYNLVIVVLETAPARVIDLTGTIEQFPELAKLRTRSWIARAHHSTHPTSDAAFFSLLTSFYRRDSVRKFDASVSWTPSFLHALRDRGYATELALPQGALRSEEERMWRAAGIETLRTPAPAPGKLVIWAAPWREREPLDREALREMLADIRRWSAASQPFVTIYYPQSSHAPWPDIIRDGGAHSALEKGRAVFARIDSLIGEITTELEALGELDHTLILVTGDHGIRTREEDPEFPVGKIDDYTFHVPFLLFAPGILGETVEIPWLTSHIDVSPTIEALFGVDTAPGMAQGSPIWEPQLAGRTTFFWSGQFHGAVGYHQAGKFAMWNHFYDEVFVNSSLEFNGLQAIPADSTGYRDTVRLIQEMDVIDRRWTGAVLRRAD